MAQAATDATVLPTKTIDIANAASVALIVRVKVLRFCFLPLLRPVNNARSIAAWTVVAAGLVIHLFLCRVLLLIYSPIKAC